MNIKANKMNNNRKERTMKIWILPTGIRLSNLVIKAL
jgi:hypothetical protein